MTFKKLSGVIETFEILTAQNDNIKIGIFQIFTFCSYFGSKNNFQQNVSDISETKKMRVQCLKNAKKIVFSSNLKKLSQIFGVLSFFYWWFWGFGLVLLPKIFLKRGKPQNPITPKRDLLELKIFGKRSLSFATLTQQKRKGYGVLVMIKFGFLIGARGTQQDFLCP